MVFRVPFPPVNYNGGSKGARLLAAHAICCFSDPAHMLWWARAWVRYLRHFPCCKTVGVAGDNMQWGHFVVCPSSSQKRESTAFDLILQSAWGLSSPGKQVGRNSTRVRKGAKFGVEKVNGGQNICNRVASVGNGKNFEK